MSDIVDISGRPATHDANGVKITMPFVVTLAASFIVEARDRTQAMLAIQRATSFSAGITPYNLGIELSADNAPQELLIKLRGKKE